MFENNRICKKCFLEESGEEDILTDIKARISKLPEKDKADEKIYRQRLDLCAECENLVGGVCMKCGCYPEFRAAFKKNKCPDAAKKYW